MVACCYKAVNYYSLVIHLGSPGRALTIELMATPKKSAKKQSRKARRAAVASGQAPKTPRASTSTGPRTPAQPAPISREVERAQVPTAPAGTTRVTFSNAAATRTDTGIDKRLAEIELPAIRKDLKKLALTLSTFGVIFVGLAVLGTQTDMVQQLGKSLFSLWQ